MGRGGAVMRSTRPQFRPPRRFGPSLPRRRRPDCSDTGYRPGSAINRPIYDPNSDVIHEPAARAENLAKTLN